MNSKLQLVVLNSGVISLESNVSHDVNSFLIPTATNHVVCVIVLPRALCRSEFKPRHMVFVFSFFFIYYFHDPDGGGSAASLAHALSPPGSPTMQHGGDNNSKGSVKN